MAHSTSATAFLTVEKSMTYRGVREHWSNAYHFDQVPPSSAAWDSIRSDIVFAESVFLDADVQFERVYGHEPGTPPILVYEVDYPPTGEGGLAGAYVPQAGEYQAPGDAAGWIRWGTTQKTSLGKPIFLRNYYHAMYVTSNGDQIVQRQHDGMLALGQELQSGVIYGGTTFRRAGPRGAVAQNHAVSTWVTTRTLKHRGRRHRITKADLEAAARARDVPVFVGP